MVRYIKFTVDSYYGSKGGGLSYIAESEWFTGSTYTSKYPPSHTPFPASSSLVIQNFLACQLSSDWSSAGEMDDSIKLELAFSHQENTLVTLTWAQLRALDIHTEDTLHVSCHGGRSQALTC